MAPVTYYYLFSMISLLGICSWLAGLIYMRLTGRSIFGKSYKIGTPVYERVMKVASWRNILITTVVALLVLANLVWSIIIVLRVNTPSAQLLLVIAPVVTLVVWIFGMVVTYKGYQTAMPSEGKRKKTVRKHGKGKDDSWLS